MAIAGRIDYDHGGPGAGCNAQAGKVRTRGMPGAGTLGVPVQTRPVLWNGVPEDGPASTRAEVCLRANLVGWTK